jgi:hypothetical protein
MGIHIESVKVGRATNDETVSRRVRHKRGLDRPKVEGHVDDLLVLGEIIVVRAKRHDLCISREEGA